jgi:hypothetical protein
MLRPISLARPGRLSSCAHAFSALVNSGDWSGAWRCARRTRPWSSSCSSIMRSSRLGRCARASRSSARRASSRPRGPRRSASLHHGNRIDVTFCDPQSPWQRGSNENTNRLLRQYFPRGTDLAQHSQAELSRIARRLNERPGKTLDFETLAGRFNECVASTR